MGFAGVQNFLKSLQTAEVLMRRSDSFGSSGKYRLSPSSSSGKLGAALPGGSGATLTEGTRKMLRYGGLLLLEIAVVVFLFYNRSTLTHRRCDKTVAGTIPRLPPSTWYYEHVYTFPSPKLRILNEMDGAPPIRSTILPRDTDITIATHTTAERLPAVKMTALRWSGAMVVAVLATGRHQIPSLYALLLELHAVVEAERRCRLTIQMVMEEGPKTSANAIRSLYPINAIRNLALRMVTSDLVFLIDADMVPSPGLHEHLTNDQGKYHRYLQMANEHHVLVVPAFQMIQDRNIAYRESVHALPHTVEELREAWWNGILDCFLCDSIPEAHGTTDYPRFIDPYVHYAYPVPYREGYEPFIIAATNNLPQYDPRFRGYAKNRAAHTYQLAAKGYAFKVIQEGFLVELPHLPSASQRAYSGVQENSLQKLRTDALYRRFKSEMAAKTNQTKNIDIRAAVA